jgi:hypothetical protein
MLQTAPNPIAAAVTATKPSFARCRICVFSATEYARRLSVSRDPA